MAELGAGRRGPAPIRYRGILDVGAQVALRHRVDFAQTLLQRIGLLNIIPAGEGVRGTDWLAAGRPELALANDPGSACRLAVGEVPPDGFSRRAVFVVRVGENPEENVEAIVNTVSVTDDGTNGPELDPTNNTVTEVTPVRSSEVEPLLYATKTDRVVAPEVYGVEGGLVAEYLVLVENLGTIAVPELRFEPHGDPATVYLEGSAAAPQGRVEEVDGSFLVHFGELPPGATYELSFAVHLEEPFPPFLARIECQGRFTSPATEPVLTDDPETSEPLDPTVTPVDAPAPQEPVEIPTLSGVGLAGMVLGLAWVAIGRLRRRDG